MESENADLATLVGDEISTELVLRNVGKKSLTLIEYVYWEIPSFTEGPQFTIEPRLENVALGEGESTRIRVHFSPVRVDTASVMISVSTPSGIYETSLEGTGINNPPVVLLDEVSGPACQGVPVIFRGQVTDVEDSQVLDGMLARVESSIEGILAEGMFDANGEFSREIALTEVGGQIITLSTRDSQGEEGSDSVTLTVEDIGLPECQFQQQNSGQALTEVQDPCPGVGFQKVGEEGEW